MNRIINAFQGNHDSPIPIWLMRQAGRYLPEYQAIRKKIPTFIDLCFHEELATEVTLQPLRRFDLDGAILFSDILVIPHVLGQDVQFIESKGPILGSLTPLFFEKAKEIDLQQALSVPLKILHNVRKALPSTKAVFGFAGSPWTIATYMLEQGKSADFKKIKALLETKSPIITQTMILLEEAVGTFLMAQIHAGADVVQIFDSWAKAVPEAYQADYIVSPIRRIIARLQTQYPSTPIVYYGRGVCELYPEISKGFSNVIFGVDENVPVSVMKDVLQKISPVQGNLCPRVLLEGGNQMKESVKELLRAFQGTPYVFNLGHGILPQTPLRHVSELVELVKGS